MKVTLLRLDGLDAAMIAASCCVSPEMPTEPKPAGLYRAVHAGHLSVLEHVVATFAVEGISRACSHQLVRHRLASYSQQSQRYAPLDWTDGAYVIPESVDEMNKVCSYCNLMGEIWTLYSELISAGVPEEDARYVLPNACSTNIVVTVNARELRHMAEERMCSRAQWEIRELVSEMVRLAKEKAPVLLGDAGPKCIRLGYCPEARSCGRTPRRGER